MFHVKHRRKVRVMGFIKNNAVGLAVGIALGMFVVPKVLSKLR